MGELAVNLESKHAGVSPATVMVVMMFLGYAVNFMDRQIVSVLVEPIKTELRISDGQVGLLTGLSFAIFYAVMGLPIATLADRWSRKKIIVAAMTLWSLTTALFGVARTYPEMFLARMAVGVGEAGFAPAAFSMIADYYPRERRGTAVAVGAMGAMAGTTLGLMVGGYVAQRFGWRTAMLIAGAPGLVLAALFAVLVREPLRGASGGSLAPTLEPLSFRALLRNPPYLMVVGSGMAAMCVMFACLQWFPAYLIRSYHMTGRAAGTLLGPMLGGIGAASLLASGYATDVLSRRDIRWGAWIPGIGALLGAPLLAASFYIDGKAATLVLFGLGYFAVMFFSAPNTAMIQFLVPLSLRARATAIFLLMTTLVGFGVGPMVAGYISEAYRPSFGQESLRYALMTLTPMLLVSPLLLSFAARRLKRVNPS
jgi:predicted MFS family arabinose efflux permease